MKKRKIGTLFLLLTIPFTVSGCSQNLNTASTEVRENQRETESGEEEKMENKKMTLKTKITELEDGLSSVRFDGDYGFDDFLEQGGASHDGEVLSYLVQKQNMAVSNLRFGEMPFGCSTLSVQTEEGGYLFGRNFDWSHCNAMITGSYPDNGYASLSTVNLDFIQAGGLNLSDLPEEIQVMAALYAPLDGMNEKGFAISVNMIQDSASIHQDTSKPNLTTTTAIRMLLNQAADVEEALSLLNQYDFHSSMEMMIHFAMADASGRSVVVEYIDNNMVVTETPVVTNFYLSEGEKYGMGSTQSQERYRILNEKLEENPKMNPDDVKEAMDSVSKDNFNEFESTEWTVIMDQNRKEMTYYHRENYENGYLFQIE